MFPADKTALDLLDEACALSGESPKSLSETHERFLSRRLEPGDKYTLPTYIIASGPLNQQTVQAAETFYQAGRLFERRSHLKAALESLYWSYRLYERLPGDEFRDKEALSLFSSATVNLSLAERAKDERERAEYYRSAAEFFMRAAWVAERSNSLKDARDYYSNAAHRYHSANAMKESAYAAHDEADVSNKLGETERAAQSLVLAAERLAAAEKGRPPSDVDILRHVQSEWYREAAYHYKKLGTQQFKKNALDAFESATRAALSTHTPELQKVLDDYREAIELAQGLGRHEELDQLRYSFHTARRGKASQDNQRLFVFLSQLNDLLWGYGTMPLRLGRAMSLTVVIFGIIYFVCGQVQLKMNSIDREISPGLYALVCIAYSVYVLLPTGIIKWLTGFGLIVQFEVSGVSVWFSAIQAVVGLIYLAMATVFVQRTLRRMFHEKPE